MFQPTTEWVNSLTIDDVTGQAVPESGTGRTERSVAISCKPHSRYLQSMCPRWSDTTITVKMYETKLKKNKQS